MIRQSTQKKHRKTSSGTWSHDPTVQAVETVRALHSSSVPAIKIRRSLHNAANYHHKRLWVMTPCLSVPICLQLQGRNNSSCNLDHSYVQDRHKDRRWDILMRERGRGTSNRIITLEVSFLKRQWRGKLSGNSLSPISFSHHQRETAYWCNQLASTRFMTARFKAKLFKWDEVITSWKFTPWCLRYENLYSGGWVQTFGRNKMLCSYSGPCNSCIMHNSTHRTGLWCVNAVVSEYVKRDFMLQ